MSFGNKSLFMPRDAGCLTDGEMGDTSSRVNHKRANPWFMGSDPELLCNKKQVIESPRNRPVSATADVNISHWDNAPGLVSSKLNDHLSSHESIRAFNLSDKNLSSVDTGNLNFQREGFEDQFDNAVSLSMSQSMDNHLCLNSGVGKNNINQVANSEHFFSAPLGHSYTAEGNDTMTMSSTYLRTGTSISLGPSYVNENRNAISIGSNFSKIGENLISEDQTFSKGDGTFMLMGHHYNRGDGSMLIMGQHFDKGNCNLLSTDQLYEKDNGNFISIGSAYNQGNENFCVVDPSYDKANENFVSVTATYEKADADVNSLDVNHGKENATVMSMSTAYNGNNSSSLSMDQNYNKGEDATIPFGIFQDEHMGNDPTGSLISHYDFLVSQSSAQACKEPAQKDTVEQNANQTTTGVLTNITKMDGISRIKEKKILKKDESNNFPSNVKSLLSTGIFNGVPVTYVSWSREKKLQGVIKDSGYLCGCNNCKLSKPVNAYEFERHAGCKTKHPNNHIYFENGKTIYGVVQELKSTPQEKLFESIQNVTGSPINEKNFRTWKASYQAATRELQRIYGKDEVAVPS